MCFISRSSSSLVCFSMLFDFVFRLASVYIKCLEISFLAVELQFSSKDTKLFVLPFHVSLVSSVAFAFEI